MAYDPFGSVQRGIDFTQGIFDRSANLASGRALQTGDYNGAANAQFNNGNIAGGQGLLNQQTANQTAATAQRAASREEQQAEQARTLGVYRQATTALRQRAQREGAAGALQEFDALVPVLRLTGATDEQLAPLRQLIERDPVGALDMLESGIGQAELEFQKAGDEVLVFQGNNPVPVQRFAPRPDDYTLDNRVRYSGETNEVVASAPRAPEYLQVDPTKNLVELPGAPTPSGASGGGGFGTREEVLSFIAPIVGDFRPTSGERSREEQDALIARGATSARNSAHVGGLGQDIVPSAPREQWDQIANDLRATGRFGRVLVETGSGRNQGTGAHIHLEPRVGGSAPAAQNDSPRVVQAATQRAAGEGVRLLSAEEKRAAGLPEGGAYQQDGQGRITAIGGSNERFTQDQRQAAGFTFRLQNATRTLDRLASEGLTRPSPQILLGDGTLNSNIRSESDRRFVQAAREWLAPVLRRDTGAAVTDGELITYGQIYIPLPTDSPAVLEQKRQARTVAEQALRGQAGGAYDELITTVNASPAPAGPARRLRFQASPEQLSASQRIVASRQGGAEPARGTAGNPILINPADARGSYGNVRAGQFYLDPTGQLRQRR